MADRPSDGVRYTVAPDCAHGAYESISVDVTRRDDPEQRLRTRVECYACGATAWSAPYAPDDVTGTRGR